MRLAEFGIREGLAVAFAGFANRSPGRCLTEYGIVFVLRRISMILNDTRTVGHHVT